MTTINDKKRKFSVFGFSLLFAYILSFLFEGRVLYSLLEESGAGRSAYIVGAIIAHFVGMFGCGFLVKSPKGSKNMMLGGMTICLVMMYPFYFKFQELWLVALIVSGLAAGCSVAAWGFFLQAYTPKNNRIKSCADVLIYSNIIMIAINIITVNISINTGLMLVTACLIAGMVFIASIDASKQGDFGDELNRKQNGASNDRKSFKSGSASAGEKTAHASLKIPMRMLFIFVVVITIDSGMMYQVINPAFENLKVLTSWYWAVPYIAALLIMRNLSEKHNRSSFLYIGMAMIMGAYIAFMLLGRGIHDYIIIDTLMLGACGIYDLFWWSIIGETLSFASNPAKIFGIGLSANVFGVLLGELIGFAARSIGLTGAEVTVIALCVVCVTLVILPLLNNQLALLLKNHAYLKVYEKLDGTQRAAVISSTKALSPLTSREAEVLQLVLIGMSNRDMAAELFISENTVKTHMKNIFSKFNVSSRAELITAILRNQTNGHDREERSLG